MKNQPVRKRETCLFWIKTLEGTEKIILSFLACDQNYNNDLPVQ